MSDELSAGFSVKTVDGRLGDEFVRHQLLRLDVLLKALEQRFVELRQRDRLRDDEEPRNPRGLSLRLLGRRTLFRLNLLFDPSRPEDASGLMNRVRDLTESQKGGY